ncbi:MAG TPA: uracil-DNA glycosylase family protein, partial [Candidatus Coprenecus stercoravium]|nr:uracil-DNA glycosylase family protein [Candidatus Coprenecus stercoravium]
MWRIMGQIFYGDKEHFIVPGQKRFDYEMVVDFCRREGIALHDAAYMVKRLRGNASDNFLKIIEPTDIQSLLSSMPSCGAVVSTGGKSAEQIAGILGVPVPAVGGSVQFTLQPSQRTVTFHRMPSSSRAYPMPLDRKAAAYKDIIKHRHCL